MPSASSLCCVARLHFETNQVSCPWHRVWVGKGDSGNKNRKGQTALFTLQRQQPVRPILTAVLLWRTSLSSSDPRTRRQLSTHMPGLSSALQSCARSGKRVPPKGGPAQRLHQGQERLELTEGGSPSVQGTGGRHLTGGEWLPTA